MSSDHPARRTAELLLEAAAGRRLVEKVTQSQPSLDVDGAYAVQAEMRRLVVDGGAPLSGWKLGLTSRAKQEQMHVAAPIRGYLTAPMALDPGEALRTDELVHPRCEPEIAFVMAADLASEHVTAQQVLTATAGVTAAVEVIDSRYDGFSFTLPDVVADNTSAARYCLAPQLVPPRDLDLRLLGVVLEHNGHVVATAAGAACLDHPAAAVAWLVRHLAGEGLGLRAGDVVLSGALTAAFAVAPGDVVTATVDRLGTVELACR